MRREDHPLYQQAVVAYLDDEVKAFSRWLTNRKLAAPERTLLRARALLRSRKPATAIRLLVSMPRPASRFLEAEQQFVLGSAHFFGGEFEQAATHNTRAVALYREIQDRRGMFLSHYNLSVDLSRMGVARVAQQHLQASAELAQGPVEEALVARALACYHSARGDFEAALEHLNPALRELSHHTVNDRAALLVVAADILFRAGHRAEARAHLETARALGRHHREVERVDFERSVITWLEAGGPFPARTSSTRAGSESGLKWDCLHALQSGEKDRAARLWSNLRKESPALFGAPFEIDNASERKTAFGQAVARLCRAPTPRELPRIEVSGFLDRLLKILQSSPTALRREELIEAIWQTPYDPAYDARFYKLMQRLKSVSGVQVECINRAYRVKRAASA